MTPDQLVTYQWFADKTEIPDEDGATLAVTEDMVGKKLSVKVTSLIGEVATSDATAAVVKSLPDFTDVKQLSAKEIQLEFDSDASSIDKDDIDVAEAESGLKNPVEKVELVTPTTIKATLTSVLKDETTYLVTVGDAVETLEAHVGKVVAIRINTHEAVVNKPTKIEYQLLDENGVDVTSTQKVKETVFAEITGTYKAARTSNPEDLSVTMDTEETTCNITLTYSTGEGSDEQIVQEGTITCIPPTAVGGKIKYAKTSEVNKKSRCAKFYLDTVGGTDPVSIGVGATTEDTAEEFDGAPVFFSAFDDNGDAIEYDQYEVESMNEAKVAAKTRTGYDSGKFAVIDLAGNEKGSTQVKVIATKNNKEKEYYIDVNVKDIADMVKVKLSGKTSMSNAYDTDYVNKITATIHDESDEKGAHFETIKWELKDEAKYKEDESAAGAGLGGLFGWTATGAPANDKDLDVVVKAWGAAEKHYTVVATADLGDFTKSQNFTVNVQSLPKAAWDGSNGGVKLSYGVEVAKSINNIGGNDTIRLAATVGESGLFAGYVRQADVTNKNDVDHAVGKVVLNDDYAIPGDYLYYSVNAKVATDAAVAIANIGDVEGEYDLSAGDVPSEIYLYKENGDFISRQLIRVAPTELDLQVGDEHDPLGWYSIAQPGDATEGGVVTVGLSENGPGTVWINKNFRIATGSLKWTIKYGVKPLATGDLFGFLENANAEKIDFFGPDGKIPVISDRAQTAGFDEENGFLTYIVKDTTYDYDIARPGTYYVEFSYTLAEGMKSQTAKNNFTVVDKVATVVPKVELLTKTAEYYNYDSFKDILKLNVDLNNNTGVSESLIEPGLIKKWKDADGDGYFNEWEIIDSNDKYAKYAIVVDDISDVNIFFFVPVLSNIYTD